jgi:autotransporter-associated beta strand protein
MTLTGSGGNATVDTAGCTVTFSGSLSGAGGLVKTDSGSLVLSGSNLYSGGTTVSGGILQYSGEIATASAGALALIGSSSETISMTSCYASLSPGASVNVTCGGALTPSGTTYRLGGGGGTLTFTPVITGAASLNVSGPGAVVLDNTNTYTGGTTVSGGTLDFSTPQATPSVGIVTVSTGGYVVLAALVGTSSPAIEASGTDVTETAANTSTVATSSTAGAGGAVASGGANWLGDTDSMAEAGPAAAVPEPSTIALLGAGAIGLLGYVQARRRRWTA